LGLSQASDLLRMQASSAFKLTSNPCPRRSHLKPLKRASKPRLLRVSRSRSTNRSYNPTHSQLRHGVGDASGTTTNLRGTRHSPSTGHPLRSGHSRASPGKDFCAAQLIRPSPPAFNEPRHLRLNLAVAKLSLKAGRHVPEATAPGGFCAPSVQYP
jgi:hypothetical protein